MGPKPRQLTQLLEEEKSVVGWLIELFEAKRIVPCNPLLTLKGRVNVPHFF